MVRWRGREASASAVRKGSAHELVNDLEAPVVARHPEIGRIISALRRSGATQAAMSGSGSAVFGLFSVPSRRDPAATRVTLAVAPDARDQDPRPRRPTRDLPPHKPIV